MIETARDFLVRCFAPGSTIALLLRTESPAKTQQRVVTLEQALAPRYLGWLAHENHHDANVYVAANPPSRLLRVRLKGGVTVDGMGFLLHNRGAGFSLDPKSPNALAGGKRPRHTIIPAFMERGDTHIGFGIMGGPNQPLAHAQFVSNIVDYGMNIQQALESARFTASGAPACEVKIEFRVPALTLLQLSERGHQIQIQREYTKPWAVAKPFYTIRRPA